MNETMQRNPVTIFPGSKALSQYVYECDLRAIANLLGSPDPFTYDWAALRFQHTQAIQLLEYPLLSRTL